MKVAIFLSLFIAGRKLLHWKTVNPPADLSDKSCFFGGVWSGVPPFDLFKMAFWPFIHFLLKVEMCKTPSFFSASRLICLSMVGIFLQTPSSYLTVTHFFIVTQSCCYMACVCFSTVSLSDGQIVISF